MQCVTRKKILKLTSNFALPTWLTDPDSIQVHVSPFPIHLDKLLVTVFSNGGKAVTSTPIVKSIDENDKLSVGHA